MSLVTGAHFKHTHIASQALLLIHFDRQGYHQFEGWRILCVDGITVAKGDGYACIAVFRGCSTGLNQWAGVADCLSVIIIILSTLM